MEKTKLNIRDFITIGIISAIAVVLFMVVGTLVGATPIGWLFVHSVLAFPFGILYMLLYAKVPKKGVVLISSLVFALVMLMNNWIIPAVIVAFAIVNELIWRSGEQRRFFKMVLAFTIFMASWTIASFGTLVVFKDMYLTQFAARAEFFQAAYDALVGPLGIVVLASTIVCSILGSLLGRALLKKHFVKAGVA